jgi:hypothetical protein
VRVPLWEWQVARGARCSPVGLSGTRHGAMAALSRALIEAGRPGRGSIVPVVLVDSMYTEPYYQRFPVISVAVYEQGAIRWC